MSQIFRHGVGAPELRGSSPDYPHHGDKPGFRVCARLVEVSPPPWQRPDEEDVAHASGGSLADASFCQEYGVGGHHWPAYGGKHGGTWKGVGMERIGGLEIDVVYAVYWVCLRLEHLALRA